MYNNSQPIWSFSKNRLHDFVVKYCCDRDTFFEVKYATSIHHTDSATNNNVVDGIEDVLDDE